MIRRTGNDVAIRAGGLGFDSQAGQTVHWAANGSPPLRRFFGIQSYGVLALSCGDGFLCL